MRGNGNLLGEDGDRGLVLQSSKDQRVWVVGLGDLVVLELATMVDLRYFASYLSRGRGGVYTPSQNVVIAAHLVQTLWSPGPETPHWAETSA